MSIGERTGFYTSLMLSSGEVRTSQIVKPPSGILWFNDGHLILIESTGFGGETLDLLNCQNLHHLRLRSRSVAPLRLNNRLHNQALTTSSIRRRSSLFLTTRTQLSPYYTPILYP